jgi:hypothetical protein
VVGELQGFFSPEASCIAQGVWVMEAGDVRVPVGANRVVVPIYVSTPEPITGLQLLLDVDLERFALVTNRDAALEATVGPDPDFLGIGFGHYSGLPIIGIVYRLVALREGVVPAGLRQRIVNVVLRPLGDFPGGEVDRVGFAVYSIDERIAEESVFTKLGSESQRPHFTIPGEIRFGTSDPPEPLELHWALEPPAEGGGAQGGGSPRKDVVLRWRNGAAYDAVWIERNGAALAELPGSATEFRDPGVLAGVWTYKVRGVVAGKTTFPARVFLSTISPPGSFLRGDADIDGQITINDPVATLNFLFLGGPALRCDDGADADDDGHLTITDPINTLGYLFLGTSVPRAPGTSFPWFDPTPDSLGCRS